MVATLLPRDQRGSQRVARVVPHPSIDHAGELDRGRRHDRGGQEHERILHLVPQGGHGAVPRRQQLGSMSPYERQTYQATDHHYPCD